MKSIKRVAIGGVIFSLLLSVSASVASAQPFEYCKFETKEGAQCPAATYAGNQTPFPNANCSGTPSAEQVCCCTKGPTSTTPKTVSATEKSEPLLPQLQVTIPGFEKFSASKCTNGLCETPWIGEYIKALYNYGLVIIGVLAVIVMMIGGILWLTAGGNQERIGQGKGFIRGGVFGITLGICSYLILFIINPNLTVLTPINVGYITKEDVEDTSEPVPTEEINKNPNKSKIELDKNKWQTVPNDKSGLAIWTPKTEKSSAESIAALKKAAECFKKLNPQNNIKISDASRSEDEQKSLYTSNCCSGKCKCSPPTCNPYGGVCPHTSGAAFDAWACTGGSCKGETRQKELQGCMIQAGFCLLASECWHFEYPQISSKCGTTKHYTGKYCN